MTPRKQNNAPRGKRKREYFLVQRCYFNAALKELHRFGKQILTVNSDKMQKVPAWLSKHGEHFYLRKDYFCLVIEELKALCGMLKVYSGALKKHILSTDENESWADRYIAQLRGIDKRHKILFNLIVVIRICGSKKSRQITYAYQPFMFDHSQDEWQLFAEFTKYHFRTHDVMNALLMDRLTAWGGPEGTITRRMIKEALPRRNKILSNIESTIKRCPFRNNGNEMARWIISSLKRKLSKENAVAYSKHLINTDGILTANITEAVDNILADQIGVSPTTLKVKILPKSRKS